jgi:radical SAM superfamily enzyme YgiQ (UPF0313 family)
MNVLFIGSDSLEDPLFKRNPRKPLFSQMDIQMGISYLSSVLKQNRHRTDLLVVTNHTTEKDLESALKNFKPGLICFTAVFREFETITRLAEYLKATYPAIFLLAGGPHISLNPEIAIQASFDAICIGEGEYPVLELVEKLEQGVIPKHINNLWIKTEAGIERNPTRPFIQDLDQLPFPDRDMWQKWINSNTFHYILLGRGCPFNCTYCCNHALRRIAGGKYVRFRSPRNIIVEINELTEQFPDISHLYLEVEAINLNMDFLTEFCRQMEVYNQTIGNRISYGVNFRIIPSQNIRNIFELLQKANINEINIGLESGNERIRKEMMNRDYSNNDALYAVKTAKEFGFSIMLYVMLGIPTETGGEFQDTINLIKECNPEVIQLSIFCPYPGTALYHYCLKYQIITGEVKDRGRHVACIDLPGFSKKQIQKQYDDFMAYYGPVSVQYLKKRKK